MNEELFDELVASVREGGAILRGESHPSRQFLAEGSDVQYIRASCESSPDEKTP